MLGTIKKHEEKIKDYRNYFKYCTLAVLIIYIMLQNINFLSSGAIASPPHGVDDKSFVSGTFLFMEQQYTDTELWMDIKDYEGIYQISNHGRVKSLARVFTKNVTKRKEIMTVSMPEMIRVNSIKHYPQISLWRNGKAKWITIHRLVAMHFVHNPDPENYNCVLHKDDNPQNPHWSNLTWGTQSQNILDCVKKGRGFNGIRNGNSKLSEANVHEIRKMLNDGITSRKIGKKFGVSKLPILSIKNNKTWQHLK